MRSNDWLQLPHNACKPFFCISKSWRRHPRQQELELRDAAALRLTGGQPRAGDDPHIAAEGLLAARDNFGTAGDAAAASAGHDEVCAYFLQIGRESGAEGREGGNEQLALGKCDAWCTCQRA